MTEPLLIADQWCSPPPDGATFHSFDPVSGARNPERFPVSDWAQLERIAEVARTATIALRETPPGRIATFLERFAEAIEGESDALAAAAARETALPLDTRLLGVELPRTVAQLRAAAEAARDQSPEGWRRPRIDRDADIRSVLEPLDGAVLVMGPNNFPFAFNAISGGDFAAALAAGNSIIAKGHPAHPLTTQLLARCAASALRDASLPAGTVQCFYHAAHRDVARLIEHPAVAAVAFTGGESAGRAVKSAADRSGTICSLEMSSLNPVVLCPGLDEEELDAFAEQWGASVLMGSGQFCTKPGICFMLGEQAAADRVVSAVAGRFSESPAMPLLTETLVRELDSGVQQLQDAGAVLECGGTPGDSPGFHFQPTLLRVNTPTFLEMPVTFQRELFGPAAVVVDCEDRDQLECCIGSLGGQLTCCVWTGGRLPDPALGRDLGRILRPLCGRLLRNKMPTGVAVTDAMVHGGPFPATAHPGFTAVGLPESIHRFAARRCYDGVPEDELPAILR